MDTIDLQTELVRAHRRAIESQRDIDTQPKRKYAMIVAIDLAGAFSKDGKIPWNHKEDFKWFQQHTTGHVCVMGRTTYDDINAKLGDKAAESVLPGRKCFVVTSSALPRDNATPITSLSKLDLLLGTDTSQTVFFCGGERIYSEGISYCDELLITVVNTDVGGDRYIPRKYIMNNFSITKVQKDPDNSALRFVTYTRNRG